MKKENIYFSVALIGAVFCLFGFANYNIYHSSASFYFLIGLVGFVLLLGFGFCSIFETQKELK